MILNEWARNWGIPQEAVVDLRSRMNTDGQIALTPPHNDTAISTEAGASNLLRLSYAQNGHTLWRNNVGAVDPISYAGQVIRYGLANDSKRVNERVKSSDLIGITRIMIAEHHVGQVIGQFTAREVKKPGWKFRGTSRELAQERYLNIVNAAGGDAKFSVGS